MSRFSEVESLRVDIDNYIHRLKADYPNISCLELTNIVNSRFGIFFSPKDILAHLEIEETIDRNTITDIMSQFQRYKTDFAAIASRIGIPSERVRKEIIGVLTSNIYRLCIIVRKRNISKLRKNFISKRNCKYLALLILKPHNFTAVRQEYSILWNFISRKYQEGHFRSIPDDTYRKIYRELIILAEFYKITEALDDEPFERGFEHHIVCQNKARFVADTRTKNLDPFALLNEFKNKKQKHLTIDLVSDEEQQAEQRETEEKQITASDNVGQGEVKRTYLIGQLADLYAQMSELESLEENGYDNLRDQMAQTALKICTIEYLIGWS